MIISLNLSLINKVEIWLSGGISMDKCLKLIHSNVDEKCAYKTHVFHRFFTMYSFAMSDWTGGGADERTINPFIVQATARGSPMKVVEGGCVARHERLLSISRKCTYCLADK